MFACFAFVLLQTYNRFCLFFLFNYLYKLHLYCQKRALCAIEIFARPAIVTSKSSCGPGSP